MLQHEWFPQKLQCRSPDVNILILFRSAVERQKSDLVRAVPGVKGILGEKWARSRSVNATSTSSQPSQGTAGNWPCWGRPGWSQKLKTRLFWPVSVTRLSSVRGREAHSGHCEAVEGCGCSITVESQMGTKMEPPPLSLLLRFFKLNIPLSFNHTP